MHFLTLLYRVAREEQRAVRAARELRRALVATTIRSYYDATIAIALTCVFALVVSLIAAVIVGGNAPSMSVAIIVFALTGAMLLLRWCATVTDQRHVQRIYLISDGSDRSVALRWLTRVGS
jgi:uncharacterized membrane protein